MIPTLTVYGYKRLIYSIVVGEGTDNLPFSRRGLDVEICGRERWGQSVSERKLDLFIRARIYRFRFRDGFIIDRPEALGLTRFRARRPRGSSTASQHHNTKLAPTFFSPLRHGLPPQAPPALRQLVCIRKTVVLISLSTFVVRRSSKKFLSCPGWSERFGR